MVQNEDNKAPQTPAQNSPGEKELPLDTRLLSEAVIELNISRKNVGIYPPGHIQITRSIDRAFQILQRLFEVRPRMTLGVAKDTLLVGNDYLDPKNPVYRDFALSLNSQGIATITFIQELGRDELVHFHRILTVKPAEIEAAGGIEKVMADSAIQHIRIAAINYRDFHVTEEQEIFKPQSHAVAKADSNVWQDFVSHLAAGSLAAPGQGISLKDAEKIDPAELAALLNQRKLDTHAAVQSYDRIVSQYIRGAGEKKQLTSEQSRTLETLNALIKELNPELRKQFLSVALQRASSGSAGSFDEMAGGFTDDMVIDMLAQANSEGREISPTLTGLIGKLSGAHAESSAEATADSGSASGLVVPEIVPESLQQLFNREEYEDHVGADYSAMLQQMTEAPVILTEDFPVQEYEQSFEDGHLDFQIGRALLAFMEENIEEADYEAFAQKLIAIVPGFLQTGNFELLFDISETLKRHAAEKPESGIREVAQKSVQIFSDPDFIKRAIDAFELWMREKGPEAASLIQSLGPDTIPGLIDIYSRDESPGGRRVLFNLLCLFGDPAVCEAHKRLRDPRAYFVRNLLILIRRAGTPGSVPHVKPLLRHSDSRVRMEALSTLLKFKDQASVKLLKDAIRSDDPDISSQAVSMAGQYRVQGATEDILTRIKRVILFETDYSANAEIAKALGEIGDPRAIPELEKLARAGLSLYPQSLMSMKEIIFATLDRYPRDSIASLLKIGERLNSDKIKRACRKLSEKK